MYLDIRRLWEYSKYLPMRILYVAAYRKPLAVMPSQLLLLLPGCLSVHSQGYSQEETVSLRQKLSAAGCPQVRVNNRKGEDGKGPNLKKSKMGEINYCPDPPQGKNAGLMEEQGRVIEMEVMKKDPDNTTVDELMSATFSLRRKRVGDQPDSIERWPAMFTERQAHGDTLREAMKDMHLGILIGYDGCQEGAFPVDVFDVAVIVEEMVVLHNFNDVATGVAMLLGIIYSVNLQYPSAMKYIFDFLQRLVMKIQPDNASARVHNFQNKLLRLEL